ncbi:MAG: hypothetical protein LBT38_04915 [Deltaproteobacteria bacterium]|jgi:hypothetical protein|nr:hypothetical protein [Deltaproteobacteria bacterium]
MVKLRFFSLVGALIITLGLWILAFGLGPKARAQSPPSWEPQPDSNSLLKNPPPRPQGLAWPDSAEPQAILAAFLGLPFREDGVINDQGDYSSWAKPGQTFKTPGFNCSGWVASVARFIWGENLSLADLSRDRQNDSGPDAPLGWDWDFGLDVALNLAEGKFSRFLPELQTLAYSFNATQKPVGLGVDIHGPDFLALLKELRADRIYIFVISKPNRRFKGGLSYYHLGFVYLDAQGGIWLQHATARSGVNRVNLAHSTGLATFKRYYPPARSGERRIVFIELFWPEK